MPASSWPRRSWLTESPTLVLLAAAVSSWVDVVGMSSATSTPQDPARTQRSLSGIAALPRS